MVVVSGWVVVEVEAGVQIEVDVGRFPIYYVTQRTISFLLYVRVKDRKVASIFCIYCELNTLMDTIHLVWKTPQHLQPMQLDSKGVNNIIETAKELKCCPVEWYIFRVIHEEICSYS